MNRALVLAGVLAAMTGAAPVGGELQVVAKFGKSLRGTLDGAPVLLLRGTHQERGLAHGVLAGKEIFALLDGFIPQTRLKKAGDWDKDFLPLAAKFAWPRRFEEELAGMLEGIRKAIPEPRSRTFASLGREIAIDDLKAMHCIGDIFGMGCSSFSAWGRLTPDGETVTGRNADYRTFPIPMAPCILAIEPAEEGLQPTIGISYFGIVASGTTLNSDGVFLAIHDSNRLPPERKDGWVARPLALQMAVEKAARERALPDIADVLHRSPAIVGCNVHVSVPVDPKRPDALPAVLEWDGNPKDQGVTPRLPRPEEAPCALFCTNHYRARSPVTGTCNRYETLSKAAARQLQEGRTIDAKAAKAMMDSVAFNGGSVTYLSVIVFPKARRMEVAFSPSTGVSATKGRWVEVGWDQIFRK